MFAVEILFLTGRYVATAHHDRRLSEWPPHPARVFSALVAAWGEEDEQRADEAAALEWLQTVGAPHVWAASAPPRSVVTHFVPVNDASVVTATASSGYDRLREGLATLGSPDTTERQRTSAEEVITKARDVERAVTAVGSTKADSALELLDRRPRHARYFPSVRPHDPRCVMAWPDANPSAGTVELLDRLAARVSRLGHSSSLVSCRVVENVPDTVPWTPAVGGSERLRVPGPDQLVRLRSAYARHGGSGPRSLPHDVAEYRPPTEAEDATVDAAHGAMGADWFVLRLARPVPSVAAVAVARALRGALVAAADPDVPAVLHGHAPDGTPLDVPHAAFVPLPFVGAPHADGDLRGVAVVLPRGIEAHDRAEVLRAIGRWRDADDRMRLTMGRAGTVDVTLETEPRLWSLDPARWAGTSREWGTATPIALPRHPGDLSGRPRAAGADAARAAARRQAAAVEEATAQVVVAAAYAGLPEPVAVQVGRAPLVGGTSHARRFPAFRSGRQPRALVHARVTFDVPVEGPVLLGAGRYLGLGLCVPLREDVS